MVYSVGGKGEMVVVVYRAYVMLVSSVLDPQKQNGHHQNTDSNRY